jgi:hypothetical protein
MKVFFLLASFSVSSLLYAQKRDSLQFSLPEKYHLHLEEKQEDDRMVMMEYIPEGQNWDNYEIIVTKLVSKNLAQVPLQTFFDNTKKLLQSKTKNLKIKELSRNKKGEREYILFTAEADAYRDSKDTESQIQYYVKGENDVFMCMAALKKKNLPADFVEEWSKVFLQSRIIK